MTSQEFCLPEILASKQYPQVLRVTRPYCIKGSQYLKAGQYITVLNRRRVELISGLDHEDREFKVRKDRSANVEVVEDERVVYNLAVIVEIARYIEAIEFRKEIRLDKQTFEVGERFTIEKIGKTFRGRSKNVALRRLKDDKVYRFPLDVIGLFKLLRGKTILPLSRVLSLRTLPLNVQFLNKPTSSNFPPGVVTIKERALSNVVYVLTVSDSVYIYEAFSADAQIYVEKCSLQIPKPVMKMIPRGVFVGSREFQNEIKQYYKNKMHDLDSKLIEDIYAENYYGSATLEKPAADDKHLIPRWRLSSPLAFPMDNIDIKSTRSNSSPIPSPTPSTPEGEYDGRPAPFPRYSKKPKQRNTIHFPTIQEHNSISLTFESQLGKEISYSTSEIDDLVANKFYYGDGGSSAGSIRSYLTNSSSMRSFNSSVSSDTPKLSTGLQEFDRPFDLHESPFQRMDTRITSHSTSSSVKTDDSTDSGVIVSYNTNEIPDYAIPHSYRLLQPKALLLNEIAIYENIEQLERSNTITRDQNEPKSAVNTKLVRPEVYEHLSNSNNFSSTKLTDSFKTSEMTPEMEIQQRRVGRPEELNPLSENEVSNLLAELNLKRYIEIFRRELINGKLLRELDEKTLVNDLGLTQFQARKLHNYVHGWRPLLQDANGNRTSALSNAALWSVADVVNGLQRINLQEFARFCKSNQVDGVFLKELLEGRLMESIMSEHGLIFSGIEHSRLKAFVLKDWRPDDTLTRKYSGADNRPTTVWNHLLAQ